MITEDFATDQIFRLKILEKYPKDGAGERAIIRALQECSATNYIAERFVTEWIKTNRRCPMPCDIWDGMGTPGRVLSTMKRMPPIPPGQDVPPPEYFCNQCEDSGWYIVQLPQEIFDMPGQHYTGAKRCSHPPQFRGSRTR